MKMKFKTARNITAACYTIALIVLLFGMTSFETGSHARTLVILAALVLIIIGAGVRLSCCNCPVCGKHVNGRLLDTTKCPECGAELMPQKVKKSGKNKSNK
jgi:ssDNA-binding Zn-finger/Zn-ribbon topoisomerase 1